jgi:hypothetical protein
MGDISDNKRHRKWGKVDKNIGEMISFNKGIV